MQNVIDLNTFLRGYRRFAETSARIGFIRYEDYTTNPDQVMAVLCQRLDVPFDPEFIHHWAEYSLVTGDLQRARSDSEIASQPRRPMEDGLLSAFETNQDYQEAISILGYDTR